jgi:hypothetical protein
VVGSSEVEDPRDFKLFTGGQERVAVLVQAGDCRGLGASAGADIGVLQECVALVD